MNDNVKNVIEERISYMAICVDEDTVFTVSQGTYKILCEVKNNEVEGVWIPLMKPAWSNASSNLIES